MTAVGQVFRNPAYGVPFCWHCSGLLPFRKGGGGYEFLLVRDPCGHIHRVHARCLPDVLGDGIVNVPRGTDTTP